MYLSQWISKTKQVTGGDPKKEKGEQRGSPEGVRVRVRVRVRGLVLSFPSFVPANYYIRLVY